MDKITHQAIIEFYEERASIIEFMSSSLQQFAEEQALKMTAVEFNMTESEVLAIIEGRSDGIHDD